MKPIDSSSTNPSRFLSTVCLNLSLLCQVLSAGFAKQAAISMPIFSPQQIGSNYFYFISIGFLVIQSLTWPIALRGFTLSFAYFYMSGSYVATLLMSSLVFHENVTEFNVLGAILIVIGINIMVWSKR